MRSWSWILLPIPTALSTVSFRRCVTVRYAKLLVGERSDIQHPFAARSCPNFEDGENLQDPCATECFPASPFLPLAYINHLMANRMASVQRRRRYISMDAVLLVSDGIPGGRALCR
jgi:hypothetical protein